MLLRPNNEKTTSDFIMCVCVYSKYIYLQNKSKTNDFRYQISRLFDLLNLSNRGIQKKMEFIFKHYISINGAIINIYFL